jgi:hypothetical protein
MGISEHGGRPLSPRRRPGLRHMAVLATVVMLTACGPGATDAQRPPVGELPPTDPPATTVPSAAPTATTAPTANPLRATAAPVKPPASAAPPAAPSAAPSSDALVHKLPIGDLPGWKQVFREDFKSGDVPIGGFPGPAYDAKWSAGYKDGTPDSAGQAGEKSGYYPSKVLSVKNGMLDWYLHTENGVSMGAAPTPKIPNNSSNPHRANSLLYGRISVRFKADPLKGFKTAWLLWPDSGVWPRDGEVDFPESDLASSSFYGAVHKMGNNPRATDVFYAKTGFTSWHVATMEWSPGKVEFFLDGRSLGAGTSGTPTTPMHYILQTESCMFRICPKPETKGHLYLDWIAIWTKR